MPKIAVTVPHQLTEAEALERVKGLLGDLKQEYAGTFSQLQESWQNSEGTFAVKAMGMDLSGDLSVKPDRVDLNGKLPLTAAPFKGRVEQMIRQRMERLLT